MRRIFTFYTVTGNKLVPVNKYNQDIYNSQLAAQNGVNSLESLADRNVIDPFTFPTEEENYNRSFRWWADNTKGLQLVDLSGRNDPSADFTAKKLLYGDEFNDVRNSMNSIPSTLNDWRNNRTQLVSVPTPIQPGDESIDNAIKSSMNKGQQASPSLNSSSMVDQGLSYLGAGIELAGDIYRQNSFNNKKQLTLARNNGLYTPMAIDNNTLMTEMSQKNMDLFSGRDISGQTSGQRVGNAGIMTAKGAAKGAQFGGPWGALIGAAVGLTGGIASGISSKIRERRLTNQANRAVGISNAQKQASLYNNATNIADDNASTLEKAYYNAADGGQLNTYKAGDELDLDPREVASLIEQGYNIKFL